MKQFYPVFQVSILVVFFILNISEGKPVHDGIPGVDTGVWQDHAVKRFYGPWSHVRKMNGENVDYNDYGAPIQDFEPSIVDLPEVSYGGEEVDFQSNYEDQSNQDDGDGSSVSSESQESGGDVEWPTSGN